MNEVDNLIQALYQAAGNKVYMREIETLLRAKLALLSPSEKQAVRFLATDLRAVRRDADNNKRGF